MGAQCPKNLVFPNIRNKTYAPKINIFLFLTPIKYFSPEVKTFVRSTALTVHCGNFLIWEKSNWFIIWLYLVVRVPTTEYNERLIPRKTTDNCVIWGLTQKFWPQATTFCFFSFFSWLAIIYNRKKIWKETQVLCLSWHNHEKIVQCDKICIVFFLRVLSLLLSCLLTLQEKSKIRQELINFLLLFWASYLCDMSRKL